MQEQSPNHATFLAGACPTDKEVLSVREIIGSFLITLRKYSLYPEDNSICRDSLSLVKTRIDGFLSGHNALRLFVDKDQFLFQGEPVYQDKQKEALP
jgi:hypothetical protein